MSNEESISGQQCPMCGKKTLTLSQREMDVPYFGPVYMLSMDCSDCKYHLNDLETAKEQGPVKITFEIEDENDLKVRVVKSGQATVKIPFISTIEPGPGSQGYVSNIEGILNRVKHQVEGIRENAEDDAEKKKAKNTLKKMFKITTGQEKQKIIIEDPSGNSAIISDKAKVDKLKVKK